MHRETERTGWIIRTVFVQLFVFCALSSEQHTSTNAAHDIQTSVRNDAEMKNEAEV